LILRIYKISIVINTKETSFQTESTVTTQNNLTNSKVTLIIFNNHNINKYLIKIKQIYKHNKLNNNRNFK